MHCICRVLDAKTDAEREAVKRLREEHRNHVQYTRDRFSGYMDLAIQHPDLFLTVVVDGMDSKKAQVPRVRSDAVYSKDVENTGKPLDTRLVGAHLPGRYFLGFWTYPFFTQGGSGSASILHRILQHVLDKEGTLPRVFIVLMDNTCKENKNNQVIKYLAFLVKVGVFDEVLVIFLLVGHTHSIIDQRFSVMTRELSVRDAATLIALIELVKKLKLGSEAASFNVYTEVEQALDWSWLLSDQLTWHFQGFQTKTIDGEKHAVHAIRLSLDDTGEVVFQYKEHDRPGPWLGHCETNEPLPVFKASPAPPPEVAVLPRKRVSDIDQVKEKVAALLHVCGEGIDPEEEDDSEDDVVKTVTSRMRSKKANTGDWWKQLFDKHEAFWSALDDPGADFAPQPVDPHDKPLQSWLPVTSEGEVYKQADNPVASEAAVEALKALDEKLPVPDGLHLADDVKWVGRKGVDGEVPMLYDTFNPHNDLKEGMVVLMCVGESTLDRGWEVAIVTSVSATSAAAASASSGAVQSGRVFDGIYLRPDIPGRRRASGLEAGDWPNNWPTLPLTEFTVAEIRDGTGRRGVVRQRIWDFKDEDVDSVVIGFTPSKRGGEGAWRLRPTDQRAMERALREFPAPVQQQQQQQGSRRQDRERALRTEAAARVSEVQAVRSKVLSITEQTSDVDD